SSSNTTPTAPTGWRGARSVTAILASQRTGANSAATERTRRRSAALAIRKSAAPQRGHARVVLRRVDPPQALACAHLVAVDRLPGAGGGGRPAEPESDGAPRLDVVEDLRLEHDHARADPVARRVLVLRLLNEADDAAVHLALDGAVRRHVVSPEERDRRDAAARAVKVHERVEAARREVVAVDDDEGLPAEQRFGPLDASGRAEQRWRFRVLAAQP